MSFPVMRHVVRQEPSSTSGGSSPSPTLSPQFFFSRVDDMFTCTSATIYWSYAGPSGVFQMVITNFDVPQPSSTPPFTPSTTFLGPPPTFTNVAARAIPTFASSPDGSISEQISVNIAPDQSPFTWSAVNVPQGWYKLTVSLPSTSYSVDSRAFFVHNSSDVSCLISPLPPPTSSSSHTSTSLSSSTSSTSSTSSPSITAVPVTTSSGISKGAIAGSVIGGVAFVLTCIAAFLFIRRSKRSRAARRGASRPWGGLGSVDAVGKRRSAGQPKPYLTGGAAGALGMGSGDRLSHAERHNSRADSIGPILTFDPTQVSPHVGALPRASQSSSASRDDVNSSIHSPFDEKYADISMVDSVPPLPLQRDTSIGRNSVATAHTRTTSHTRQSSTSSTSHPRIRGISTDHSTTGDFINMTPSPSTPSTPYPPTQPPSRSHSQSGPGTSPSILPSGGITSPTGPGARRAARKPVPSYNPDDISLSPFMSNVEPPRSASAAAYTASSSMDVVCGGEEDKRSTHSTRSARAPAFPELSHKSSFGPGDNRPVHYLIPDMPPPQRD